MIVEEAQVVLPSLEPMLTPGVTGVVTVTTALPEAVPVEQAPESETAVTV